MPWLAGYEASAKNFCRRRRGLQPLDNVTQTGTSCQVLIPLDSARAGATFSDNDVDLMKRGQYSEGSNRRYNLAAQ